MAPTYSTQFAASNPYPKLLGNLACPTGTCGITRPNCKKALHEPIVHTHKGGTKGGGGAELTSLGESLLKEYKRVEAYIGEVLEDKEYWVAATLKISARNRLKGIVKSVDKGDIIAKVKVEVKTPSVITALISREAVEDLKIKTGDNVEAVIKATEIMIAKE